MFLKNDMGELVNVNKIIAVTEAPSSEFTRGLYLHTKKGKMCLWYENSEEYRKDQKAVQELLIHGPKYKQRPWTNNQVKWIYVRGNLFLLDQIECILVEGWVVDVHMTDITITIMNHSDDELEKCLNAFDVTLRSNGKLINLTGWEDE